MNNLRCGLLSGCLLALISSAAVGQEKPIVGLIPKAAKPIKMDGKLDEWSGAFVTPVNVGHPDFANRGAAFLYLWDDDNLYVGLCARSAPGSFRIGNLGRRCRRVLSRYASR